MYTRAHTCMRVDMHTQATHTRALAHAHARIIIHENWLTPTQHELFAVHKFNVRKELGARFDESSMVTGGCVSSGCKSGFCCAVCLCLPVCGLCLCLCLCLCVDKCVFYASLHKRSMACHVGNVVFELGSVLILSPQGLGSGLHDRLK